MREFEFKATDTYTFIPPRVHPQQQVHTPILEIPEFLEKVKVERRTSIDLSEYGGVLEENFTPQRNFKALEVHRCSYYFKSDVFEPHEVFRMFNGDHNWCLLNNGYYATIDSVMEERNEFYGITIHRNLMSMNPCRILIKRIKGSFIQNMAILQDNKTLLIGFFGHGEKSLEAWDLESTRHIKSFFSGKFFNKNNSGYFEQSNIEILSNTAFLVSDFDDGYEHCRTYDLKLNNDKPQCHINPHEIASDKIFQYRRNDDSHAIHTSAILIDRTLILGHKNGIITFWNFDTGVSLKKIEACQAYQDTALILAKLPFESKSRAHFVSVGFCKNVPIKFWDKNGELITSKSTLGEVSGSWQRNIETLNGYLAIQSENHLHLWDAEKLRLINSYRLLFSPHQQICLSFSGYSTLIYTHASWNCYRFRHNSFVALPDGRFTTGVRFANVNDGSGREISDIEIWDIGIRPLKLRYITSIFNRLKENKKIISLNLQNSHIEDDDIPKLVELVSFTRLAKIDLRKTKLTTAGLKKFSLGLRKKQMTPYMFRDGFVEDGIPEYVKEFYFNSCLLKNNPDDQEAKQKLTEASINSHNEILLQYHQILEGLERGLMPTDELLRSMFSKVCIISDFRYPYTLLNCAINFGDLLLTPPLKDQIFDTLGWLARNAIFGENDYARFMAVLRSAVNKKFISYFQKDILEQRASKSDVFNDEESQEIRRRLNFAEDKINHIEQRVQHVEGNIENIIIDINTLREAYKARARRSLFFSVAKAALMFIGSQILGVFESLCDFSDVIEMGCSLCSRTGIIAPEAFVTLMGFGRECITESFSEDVLMRLGVHREEFVDAWYELNLQYLKFNNTQSTSGISFSRSSDIFWSRVSGSVNNRVTRPVAYTSHEEKPQSCCSLM